MKHKTKVKFLGNTIIFSIVFSIAAFSALIFFEYTGFASNLIKINYDARGRDLIRTDYYKKKYFDDPYQKFQIQHIHPYYLFSLPWREKDIIEANNEVVQIGKDGFRVNNYINTKFSGVLTGGSAAFGHFSSSDDNTLAYRLSELLGIKFFNRNAPSWNSHQELVALLKYSKPYNLSISFSMVNDIAAACVENSKWLEGKEYLDSPESFIHLSKLVNNIRVDHVDRSFLSSLKLKFQKFFPATLDLLKSYKSENDNKSQYSYDTDNLKNCPNVSSDDIVKSIINNQTAMNNISKSRGAKHVFILQPDLDLNNIDSPDNKLRVEIYQKILQSDFCRLNKCLDLSNEKFGANINQVFNGSNVDTALFADRTHLTDRGVDFYGNIISDYIDKSNILPFQ